MTEISKGTRIVNYVIDMLIVGILAIIVQIILPLKLNPNIISTLVCFCYYLLLESIYGRTVGKLVTHTCVLDLKNRKPNFWKILIRTILRFNPFDLISYLFGQTQGTHDVLSGTRLRSSEQKEISAQEI